MLTSVLQQGSLSDLAHMPQGDLSSRYQNLDSNDVVERLEDMGLTFEGISLASAYKPSNRGFQKHLLTFSTGRELTDGNFLQLLVTNSYNGKTSLQFNLGIYRMVCANGLIVGDTIYSRRVLHKGDAQKQLEDAYDDFKEAIPTVQSKVITLSKSEYSVEDEKSYINKAFEHSHDSSKYELAGDDLFIPQRTEDTPNSVYNLYNRVQERILKGQYNLKNKETGKIRSARKKTSVSVFNDTNKFLWNEAEKIAA